MLVHLIAALFAVQGQYALAGVAADGRQFSATLHITSVTDVLGGRLLSTLANPMPLREITPGAGTLDLLADLAPGRQLKIHFTVIGDSLDGTFDDGTSRGTLRGSRVASRGGDPNDLPPVSCRVPGLNEVVRCATRWVFEDVQSGKGRRIPLNIVILPALSTTKQPDPLFLFAGGPGQASTQGASGNAQRYAEIRQQRDVVMVDQRGTGGSNELMCTFGGTRERADLLLGGVFDAASTRTCRDQLATRANLQFYHTAVAVKDIDDVRAWLGYNRINVYGGSYGTRAALEYVRAFPQNVRTATVRAVVAPGTSMVLGSPIDAQRGLEQVLAACAAEAPCAAAFPSLKAEWDSVLARTIARPTTLRVFDAQRRDSVEVAVTRGVLGGSIRRLLMDAETLRRVPLAIHEMYMGDWSTMRLGLTRTLAVGNEIAWGMSLSVYCAEEPRILQRADVRPAAATFIGDAQIKAIGEICRVWNVSPPSQAFESPVTGTTPTLLLSGEFDPSTPPRYGEQVARSLSNSLHLVLPGISHGPFPDCAASVMAKFVAAGNATGLDASCVREMKRAPFVTSSR